MTPQCPVSKFPACLPLQKVADLLLRMYKDPSSGASKALLHSSNVANSEYSGSLAEALLILSSGVGKRVVWGNGRYKGMEGLGKWEASRPWLLCTVQSNGEAIIPWFSSIPLAIGMQRAKSSARKDIRMRLLALFSDLGQRCAGNPGIIKVWAVLCERFRCLAVP